MRRCRPNLDKPGPISAGIGPKPVERNQPWPHARQFGTRFHRSRRVPGRDFQGNIMGYCYPKRGRLIQESYIQHQMRMEWVIPISEVMPTRSSRLKSAYVLVNDERITELSSVVHSTDAYAKGSAMLSRLKEEMPREQFALKLQTCYGSKVIAREDIKPYRNNVTAKL